MRADVLLCLVLAISLTPMALAAAPDAGAQLARTWGTVLIPLHGLQAPPEGIGTDTCLCILGNVMKRMNSHAASSGPAAGTACLAWQACLGSEESEGVAIPTGTVASFQAVLADVPVIDGLVRLHRNREGDLSWLVAPIALTVAMPSPTQSTRHGPAGPNPWLLSESEVLSRAAVHLRAGMPDSSALDLCRAWLVQEYGLRPVYALTQSVDRPRGERLMLLDAQTAELVEQRELLRRAAHPEGRGLVFDPNPVVASGDRTLSDGDDVDPWRIEVALHDLDGSGYLRGRWADVSNPAGRSFNPWLCYFFSSFNLHFEEVMAYYHITEAQRYLQSLGFAQLQACPQAVEVHATGTDESWFNSLTGKIYLGTGGVDDGEDADIILHEYGHALYDAAVGGFGGGDTQALTEGFADYFAATRSGDPCIGDWDGTGRASGCLRNLDDTRFYPVDLTGEPHEDGRIWSGVLWRIRDRLGAEQADILALTSLYFQTPLSRMGDAARGLLVAAREMEQATGARGLLATVEDVLGELGFQPRRGGCSLPAGTAGTHPRIPLAFPFVGPGASEGSWCDTLLVRADGTVLLQPGADGASGEAPQSDAATYPCLAPLAAQPSFQGTWQHDSLTVRWEGTLWSMAVDLWFHAKGMVVRHVSAVLSADGEITIRWHGDGDRMAFPCLVGWFPEGLEGKSTWIDLLTQTEVQPSPGEGVAFAPSPIPFPLAGATWQLLPLGDSGYRATLRRAPTPSDPQTEEALLIFPSPARPNGRIAFRVLSAGTYELHLLDPSGRCLSRLWLHSLQPGLHEVDLEALAHGATPASSGVYFVRLMGGSESRLGRLLLLR
ncbi:MAG: hypothetical protein KAY24_04140 [Candidatus Eisenbacteria sp.]|nr:hypothetical protein [Candidatus Eisenbacteria bacterium]